MSPEEKETGYIEVLVECPFCGSYVPDDFECLMCGEEIFEDMGYESYKFICSECRKEVEEDEEECPHCRAELQ